VTRRPLVGATIVAVLGAASAARAEAPRTRISAETDPVTFAFRGFALHVRVAPRGAPRLLVGAGTLLGPWFTTVTLPDLIVDADPANRGEGWTVAVRGGVTSFIEYFPAGANRGWFIGEQVGVQAFRITRSGAEGSAAFAQMPVMTYGGFAWRPLDGDLYLKPWVGLALVPTIAGTSRLDGQEYRRLPILPFATVHVGYTF
jgi:hypothetical protein